MISNSFKKRYTVMEIERSHSDRIWCNSLEISWK